MPTNQPLNQGVNTAIYYINNSSINIVHTQQYNRIKSVNIKSYNQGLYHSYCRINYYSTIGTIRYS